MSEQTIGTAKQQRMAAVTAAVGKTSMVTAKVWNPWDHVMETGVTTAELQANAVRGLVPDIIHDSDTFASIKPVLRSHYGAEAGLDGPLTEANFAEAKAALRKKYVRAGCRQYKNLPSGNCTLFACCVIGMLADQPDLLGPGVKVELVNLVDRKGGEGHAYVMVNRAPGDVKVAKSHGPDCFFVDIWYARQQRTVPGTNAVKDITPVDTSANPFWDFDFSAFIDEPENVPAVRLSFMSDELPKLLL
ncbi:hypothetical protein ABGB17_04580 [Sphaerisporangium sp. B11E5]|uniref:hypothetical protein n=1 Tax=Sphaerisporangium sp. B11E5 TaxID=3153563 RepID=UPI00325E4349